MARGDAFPEWNDTTRDCADPVIRLYGMEIPAAVPDAGAEQLPRKPIKVVSNR